MNATGRRLLFFALLLPAWLCATAQEGTLDFDARYLLHSRYRVRVLVGADSTRICFRKTLMLSPAVEEDTFYRRTYDEFERLIQRPPRELKDADIQQVLQLFATIDSVREEYATFARDTLVLANCDDKEYVQKVRAYLLRQDDSCRLIQMDGFDMRVRIGSPSGTHSFIRHSPHRSYCYPLLGDLVALTFELYRARRDKIDFSLLETFGY